MEANINENTYIIETIDYNNTNSDNDMAKECILNETPILICSNELDDASQYITCYEDGEIVLKPVGNTIIESSKLNQKVINKHQDVQIIKTEQSTKDKSIIKLDDCSINENNGSKELHKGYQKPLMKTPKKLCYEKPYNKPPLAMFTKQNVHGLMKYPRKQLIDYQLMISPREFKSQLNYTEDTVTAVKFAPCTRQKLLHVLNGITTLFAHPAHKMPNANLMQLYVSRCTCKKEANMMSSDDMNLLPLTESFAKPTNTINTSVKRIYGKRKNSTEILLETQKKQMIENVNKPSTDTNIQDSETNSNINLSSIKKIYRNRKSNVESHMENEKQQQSNYINENIDHKYSKKISNEPQLDNAAISNTNLSKSGNETVYTITLDLDNMKEEHINENQIVILSVDNDGELTENNINVLLDAANMKAEMLQETKNEVVTLTKKLESDGTNNKRSKIFMVKNKDEMNDSEQILTKNSNIITS